MPTPNERRALIFLAALGALGVGIRAFRSAPATLQGAPDGGESRAALGRQIGAVDSATAAKRAAGGRGTSRRSGARGDTTRPSESGAGEGRSTRAAPEQRAPHAPAPDPLELYEERRLDVARRNRDAQTRIERDFGGAGPGSAAPPAQPPPQSGTGAASGREPVDIETAGADAIATLPWVGPVLAARIVADRSSRGPFGSLAGLERVRGVGPGLTAKIGRFVTFSRSVSPGETVVRFRAVRVRPKRP